MDLFAHAERAVCKHARGRLRVAPSAVLALAATGHATLALVGTLLQVVDRARGGACGDDAVARLVSEARLALKVRAAALAAAPAASGARGGWMVLRARGDGGCLFTALWLARAVAELLRVARAHAHRSSAAADAVAAAAAELSGFSSAAWLGGRALRQAVVEWFARGLATPLRSGEMLLGGAATARGNRALVRGDLIANDLRAAAAPQDVCDDLRCAARRVALRRYLLHMLEPDAWGSTPEVTAFSEMASCPVVVYQPVVAAAVAAAPPVNAFGRVARAWKLARIIAIVPPPSQLEHAALPPDLEDCVTTAAAADNDDGSTTASSDSSSSSSNADADTDTDTDADTDSVEDDDDDGDNAMAGPAAAVGDAADAASWSTDDADGTHGLSATPLPRQMLASEPPTPSGRVASAVRLLHVRGNHYVCLLPPWEAAALGLDVACTYGRDASAAGYGTIMPLTEYLNSGLD